MCSCAGKRGRRKVRKYRRNSVIPSEIKETEERETEEGEAECPKVDAKFMDQFVKEAMACGFCKSIFNINSNELKIHCNICNKFFHCGIAGECIGEDCKTTDSYGNIHRARYCIGCVSKIYHNSTCLCKDCAK